MNRSATRSPQAASLSEERRLAESNRWNNPLPANRAGGYSFVYFIQEGDGGPIKVGVAVNPEERLGTLQVGNSRELRLLGVVRVIDAAELERWLHGALAPWLIRGEWFAATAEVLACVEDFLRPTVREPLEAAAEEEAAEDDQPPAWSPEAEAAIRGLSFFGRGRA